MERREQSQGKGRRKRGRGKERRGQDKGDGRRGRRPSTTMKSMREAEPPRKSVLRRREGAGEEGGRREHERGVSASGGEGLVPARLGRGAEVLQNPFSRDPGSDRQQEDEV